ncbi:ImmA/IrrE family metallo-endopeptidase [Vibrio parahaemolyticus]
MILANDFQPDWVSPPGETIVELLDESGLSIEELSKKIGLSSRKSQQLLDGDLTICDSLATKLETTFRVSSRFWLTRDSQYQTFKQKLESKEQKWLDLLPVSDMVKLGWIPKRSPRAQRVRECLRFFNQDSIDSWFEEYNNNNLAVAYRTSDSFNTEPVSVFTWLQVAKRKTNDTRVYPWDREILKDSIPAIRALTNESNPRVFVPKLEMILAEAGVVFVIAKTPSGCRASGATCFFEKNKATLVMSFRYLTDDHFWFTLFHEIGHLLLHPQNKTVRIEGNGIKGLSTKEEKEANEFATNTLVPIEHQSEMYSFYKNDWKKIVRFARKVGVSKGIILGQLQHTGNIDYAYLNKLKVRYKWTKN